MPDFSYVFDLLGGYQSFPISDTAQHLSQQCLLTVSRTKMVKKTKLDLQMRPQISFFILTVNQIRQKICCEMMAMMMAYNQQISTTVNSIKDYFSLQT